MAQTLVPITNITNDVQKRAILLYEVDLQPQDFQHVYQDMNVIPNIAHVESYRHCTYVDVCQARLLIKT